MHEGKVLESVKNVHMLSHWKNPHVSIRPPHQINQEFQLPYMQYMISSKFSKFSWVFIQVFCSHGMSMHERNVSESVKNNHMLSHWKIQHVSLRPPHQVNQAFQLPPMQCCFIVICICIQPSQTHGPVSRWSPLSVIACYVKLSYLLCTMSQSKNWPV